MHFGIDLVAKIALSQIPARQELAASGHLNQMETADHHVRVVSVLTQFGKPVYFTMKRCLKDYFACWPYWNETCVFSGFLL